MPLKTPTLPFNSLAGISRLPRLRGPPRPRLSIPLRVFPLRYYLENLEGDDKLSIPLRVFPASSDPGKASRPRHFQFPCGYFTWSTRREAVPPGWPFQFPCGYFEVPPVGLDTLATAAAFNSLAGISLTTLGFPVRSNISYIFQFPCGYFLNDVYAMFIDKFVELSIPLRVFLARWGKVKLNPWLALSIPLRVFQVLTPVFFSSTLYLSFNSLAGISCEATLDIPHFTLRFQFPCGYFLTLFRAA